MLRIGEGYDVHKFSIGRDLILGGVKIPYDMGLLGHSDADVLTHAIMDALLGSLALGDIGKYFPDTDDKYKNVDSLKLLAEVNEIISGNNKYGIKAKINNIDATIICERPKLSNFIDEMREKIAKTLNIDIKYVSIKATTEEGLGFTGKGEGIAVSATCIVEEE